MTQEAKQELTPLRLRALLKYNPKTGVFTWKEARGRNAKRGQIAGALAETCIKIKIDGRLYYAHRLAFLYMTGSFPDAVVDHIDGDGHNNKWANLRQCSHAENMQNKRVSKTNKSGLIGVSKHGDAWQATIAVNGKYTHLGRFKDPQEAHQAYLRAKANLHKFNPVLPKERASK